MSVVCCKTRGMNLAAWAERNGVARVTGYCWFQAGLLPVPARKVGRLNYPRVSSYSVARAGVGWLAGCEVAVRAASYSAGGT